MLRWVLPILAFALVGPAFASDGVLEISQTCAVQTGCFAGDTAGFPVTIDGTAGHSYRLTSDLSVPDQNTSGIVVGTSDVGLDLNNFAILGPVFCTRGPTGFSCNPVSGTGSGVTTPFASNSGISVKNGGIRGMGGVGVNLGDQAEVANVRVRWNGSGGINVGAGSTVSGNTVNQNGGNGISANEGSTVSGNTASGNGTIGIFANNGSTISGNSAYHNAGDGIAAGLGTTVQRNTMRWNSGYGLRLDSQATYRENTITFNTNGTVTGTGVNMGDNSCNGTTICP